MRARNRLELLHPAELAFVRAIAVKSVPIDDLHRPERSHHITRQPDCDVTAATDAADQLVVGYFRISFGRRNSGFRYHNRVWLTTSSIVLPRVRLSSR